MKREGDEKGTAEQSEAKNHPVNGFLVPRAGGGTGPVPPDESPYLHHQKSPEFLGFLLILGLLCPQYPTKRFHTKFHTGFHFEFHSLKEETLFIATPQSHFVRQLPGRGAFWGTLCAKIYELTLWLEQGRLTHCRSQFSLFLPVLRFAYSSTGRAQLRTSRSDRFNGVTGSPGGPKGRNRNLPWPLGKKRL